MGRDNKESPERNKTSFVKSRCTPKLDLSVRTSRPPHNVVKEPNPNLT
jgi:hypothetical protein